MKTKEYQDSLFFLFIAALAEGLALGFKGLLILIMLLGILNAIKL